MSSLSHHGIKGQKWGIRRFQNKDGTLTREGQIRFAKKNLKRAKVRNLDKWGKSPDSNVLYIIGTSGSGKSTTAKGLAEDGDQVIHLDTIFEKENHGSPDSNKDFEAFLKENNVDITKASDFSISKEERWQTYDAIGDLVEAYGQHCFTKGSKVVIEGVQMGDQTLYPDKNYFNGKPTVVLKGNIVRDTFRADRRDGVPLRKTVVRLTDRERWNWYKQVNSTSNEIKYTSIGGTMYIEGNALILGDSSYLEHHGIRGQRWGVRRFQNRDGSLTNAGRKRLGYATKGVTQTVGKAFKAGVKAGGNAVKAVKAHHEKAEAKKKEKKKEKASKTRLGVMANKDLFTNEEIRKLNERFKLEDEMKMATLQKGVEIAKAVGTIAQNVGTMAKAYEDVTGQSLSPIKRKAAEEKAKQDAEDRKRKLAKEDAETKRAEDKEKRDIEDRERRIKLEDEDRVRKQAKEDADAQRAENAEKRAQAKEQRDSSMAVELQRKAKAAADEQEHKAVKAKAESRSAILDVLEKIDKIQDHDDDDHNNPPGGGIDTWDDDDYLSFFKKTGIIHSDISDPSIIQNGVLFVDSSDSLAHHVDYSVAEAWEARGTKRRQKKRKEYEEMLNHDGLMVSDGTLYLEHHGVKGQRWGVRRFQNPDGTRTEAGKKHDAKIAAKAERKQAKADMKAAKAEAKAKAKDIKLTEKAENLRKREIERYEKMADKHPRHKEAYEIMGKHAKESDRSELLDINRAANIRGTGQAIVGALILSTFVPTPIAVAGGVAIAKAMKMNNVDYARTVTTNARLNKEARERRLKEAQSIKIEHSSGGMLIQNGTLFINAGDPYLEHHGVKGMKWGKHLMAGKGEAGAGGGSGEDDEKLKEMAKKAGMSVAEFRTKMAGKLSGAASKVGGNARNRGIYQILPEDHSGAARPKAERKKITRKAVGEALYNAVGGNAKKAAQEHHRNMVNYKNEADKYSRAANIEGSAAKAHKRAGNVSAYIGMKSGARADEETAKNYRLGQYSEANEANKAQRKYDRSLAALYDKATGKYKQVHKQTKIPSLSKQYQYYTKEVNGKLFDHGKPKTAKERAKAEVWKAADYRIKSQEYYNKSFDPTVTTYGYDAAYRKAAVDQGRLAEGAYRRAAALGKQASKETSASSRPRARKKKHTSGGSGVNVRRPGRKPVSRTKRVTQSSTGVKRRGSTGTGARVRRGA